jgi:hypothetical protein
MWEVLGSNLTMAVMAEIFCGFPQPYQVNTRIVLTIDHDHFLPNSLCFIIQLYYL